MKELDTNSLKYLTISSNDANWGMVVTTVGRQSIAPNTQYPIMRHPDAYYFKPAKGRVLNEFQIVYIYEGGGFFESQSISRQRIDAGTLIVLFPGERHSYAPDEHSGWSEYWIGFHGEIANNLLTTGFFSPKEALLKIGLSSSLMGFYRDAISIADKESVGSQQLLSGIVMHMLGHILYRHRSSTDCANRTEDVVNEARQLMRERLHHSLSAEDIANALGVGYSWFRQSFRRVTGVPPAQYISLLLISRAKEMLVSEHMSISETAYALGFESVGQFSTMFRKREGVTPRQFREGNRLAYSNK